jgi:hypothetical protein
MMIAFQTVPIPAAGQEPWPWIAAIALSAAAFGFLKWNGAQEARIARCEKREDAILEDNKAQAGTIREMSSVLLRNVSVTEGIGEMVKTANIKIESTERKLDDVRRALEELTQPHAPARRRTSD